MTDYSELVKTVNIPELVKVLRGLANGTWKNCEYTWFGGEEKVFADAAAAIEDLQAKVSKLEERTKAQQERLEDYMEKQLIIDRWGTKWMTSAKDVPTAAYEHGYADGRDEALSKVEPKQGEWNNHEVACLLAEMFGDDCACNLNGIDEWLPQYCEFAETCCPNPVGVACWEQFLKHRAKMEVQDDS